VQALLRAVAANTGLSERAIIPVARKREEPTYIAMAACFPDERKWLLMGMLRGRRREGNQAEEVGECGMGLPPNLSKDFEENSRLIRAVREQREPQLESFAAHLHVFVALCTNPDGN
jgi:hypothetical protein